MPSKTSSFKKEIFKQDFRNVGWVSLVYFAGLVFILPLQLMMDMSSPESREVYLENGLFDPMFLYGMQLILLLIIPVLMAIFLFRYVHVRGAGDFIHSLPIKRSSLFNYHMFSGILLLLLPILITGAILFITSFIWDVGNYYTLGDLSYWMAVFSVFSVFLFVTSIFVGSLTGLSAVQGVLTYILLLFPAGIYVLISYNLDLFVKGFSDEMATAQVVERFSPVLELLMYQPAMVNNEEGNLPAGFTVLLIYLGIAVLLYIAALFIYNYRNLENGSQAIAVLPLKPVFKYGVTFCFMLLGGAYFGRSQPSHYWLYMGYAVGAVIGFVISDMLLQKTWRVFSVKQLKGMGAYAAVMIVLILTIPIAASGYESALPEKSDIKNVYIGTSFHDYQRKLELEAPLINKPGNIEAVRKVHKSLIDKAEVMEEDSQNRSIFLAYQLSNGEKVFREYQVNYKRVPYMEEVYNSEEYKLLTNDVLHVEPSEVDRMTLDSPTPQVRPVMINDPEIIKKAFKLMEKDILSQTYLNMMEPRGLAASFNVEVGYEYYHTELPLSYTHFNQWLKDEGLYDRVFVQAKDVHKIEILKKNQGINPEEDLYQTLIREKGFEITDKKKIAETISTASESSGGTYLVGFYFADEEISRVTTLEASKAPNWMTNHFK
ncbi:DUF6449 domain-containing protein [Halobacillus shinanisalinarum]|uniref:DUF6449 domain-containing protein n=1 Tax=Halobacillus shinanisalinarum TaxID=2932258 RepID=A0ABY4GUH0_9BACI|nr:DUF6449 domain-containing protein [Halobacillus shinanisalinarum]UOQ91634.1 DUF6449 domain-containing protein [Halobacillus shinanisalinarum]